ncbi:MAG: hypothetical protein H7099_13210 [Gemmatimonadaceae bacterium]|nr:hypothetical protein [Gemmatimonadaceae bacterium]
MRTEPTLVSRALHLTALVLATSLAACGDGDPTTDETTLDRTAPSVVVLRATSPDSVFAFTVRANDNLGVKFVSVSLGGAIVRSVADTVTSAVTAYTKDFSVSVPGNVTPGSQVTLISQAEDGNGNKSKPDTTVMAVGSRQPGFIAITSPQNNTQAVRGRSVVVAFAARTTRKVRLVGFTITPPAGGTVLAGDSIIFSSPLQDSLSTTLSFAIPATAAAGFYNVVPYVADSIGQRTAGTPVPVEVLASGSGQTIPKITRFGTTDRVESTDTVFVEAQDPVGVGFVGYDMRSITGTAIRRDSVAVVNGPTSVPVTLRMSLPAPVGGAATRLILRVFARNTEGRLNDSLTTVRDTITLVAGTTRTLPNGGTVADGYFHEPTGRLYLTNIERNQLEVFNFDSLNFQRTAIPVGSRPWGITVFPQGRGSPIGPVQNKLIVANSGGTNLSFVSLNADGSGQESERYLLPNIVAYKVSVAGGNITRSVVDFSDRPQYVGAVCNAACSEVTVAFSTTPTGGQSGGFADKGTIRWENITRRSSHLFFEHATFLRDNKGDTLEVVRFRSGTYGSDSTLVPFPLRMDAPGFPTRDAGMLVTMADIGFRDTTFVRNSANFKRAIFGEGGVAKGSRTLTFDIDAGLRRYGQQVVTDTTTGQVTTYTSQLSFIDAGVSPPSDVSDLIANAFSPVRGVAVSADGELFAIRADSTYLFNNTLRLYGLLQTQGGNAGFDFHPLNAPGANLSGGTLATRLSFAASREPVLEVFDTRCFQRVGVIAIKDAIIGPLKTAVRGSRIVAVGATARGVVVLDLNPADYAATCN